MDRPSVGLVIPYEGLGGVQRVLLNLGAEMRRQTYRVLVVTLTDRVPGGAMTDLETVQLAAPGLLLKTRELAQLIDARSMDVLISGITRANLVALGAARLASRDAITVLTKHLPLEQLSRSPLRRMVLKEVIRRAYSRADAVVAISRGTATSLQDNGVAPRTLARIANPVITEDMQSRISATVAHPWLQAGLPPVILAAGRLTEQKGFDVLIRAFAKIRQSAEVRLIVLGEGPLRRDLLEQARSLGLTEDVSFPGHVVDALPYMSKSAVFALSSRWEGLPTVLIEALAAGATVVATDCSVGPREILADGELGELVPVDDPEALAAAISRSLSQPRTIDPSSLLQYTVGYATERYLQLIAELRRAG